MHRRRVVVWGAIVVLARLPVWAASWQVGTGDDADDDPLHHEKPVVNIHTDCSPVSGHASTRLWRSRRRGRWKRLYPIPRRRQRPALAPTYGGV